jgi:hypothetical protein
MEGKIRKDRQKLIYERQQLRDKIISVVGLLLVGFLILGLIVFILYKLKLKYGW